MLDQGTPPYVSVIVPTRDRPDIFAHALDSVLQQNADSFEVIVVDDGTTADLRPGLERLKAAAGDRAVWLHLPRYPSGHGPSLARNIGVWQARGQYIAFLDDDDLWTDRGYLARLQATLQAAAAPVELHFSAQHPYRGDQLYEPDRHWMNPLATGTTPRLIGHDEILAVGNFCHLNTLVVKRDLFLKIGGFDPALRYSGDLDIFFRLIDQAEIMIMDPAVIARHNVPVQDAGANVSTGFSTTERRNYEAFIWSRLGWRAKHAAIQKHARRAQIYATQNLAELLYKSGDARGAFHHARAALAWRPSPAWALRTVRFALTAAGLGGSKDRQGGGNA